VSRLNGLRQRRALRQCPAPRQCRGLAPLAVAALAAPLAASAASGALFQALPLEQTRFVLVAAPIGDGSKAQLNIYEQVRNTRPCFEVAGQNPAAVNPLLGTFDFTGICGRYIDTNGYSLRVGESDLATSYRLSVTRTKDDTLLVALPTKAGAGPEMVVARTNGLGGGFLQLVFEPGWVLKRRAFSGRALGHVYVYRDAWPDTAAVSADGTASSSAISTTPDRQTALTAPPLAR